jgi:hypothetical protein
VSDFHHSPSFTAIRRKLHPEYVAALPLECIDCHRPINPGQSVQVGHRFAAALALRAGWSEAEINSRENLGPSHGKSLGQRGCNQSAGAALGNRLRATDRRAANRMPNW